MFASTPTRRFGIFSPGADQTNIKATIQNHTLRQGLTAITQKLALEFVLTDESVQLRPIPALQRLGRRATVDELEVLDLMTRTPMELDHPTAGQIVRSCRWKTRRAEIAQFAIDDHADNDNTARSEDQHPRNASMADVLEDLCQQTRYRVVSAGQDHRHRLPRRADSLATDQDAVSQI